MEREPILDPLKKNMEEFNTALEEIVGEHCKTAKEALDRLSGAAIFFRLGVKLGREKYEKIDDLIAEIEEKLAKREDDYAEQLGGKHRKKRQERLKENLTNFHESIILEQPMAPDEAIEKLCAFHNASPASVLKAFFNLRGFNEGSVVFSESVNNGSRCIVMEGKDKDGKFAWNELIDMYTGQPLTRTS